MLSHTIPSSSPDAHVPYSCLWTARLLKRLNTTFESPAYKRCFDSWCPPTPEARWIVPLTSWHLKLKYVPRPNNPKVWYHLFPAKLQHAAPKQVYSKIKWLTVGSWIDGSTLHSMKTVCAWQFWNGNAPECWIMQWFICGWCNLQKLITDVG